MGRSGTSSRGRHEERSPFESQPPNGLHRTFGGEHSNAGRDGFCDSDLRGPGRFRTRCAVGFREGSSSRSCPSGRDVGEGSDSRSAPKGAVHYGPERVALFHPGGDDTRTGSAIVAHANGWACPRSTKPAIAPSVDPRSDPRGTALRSPRQSPGSPPSRGSRCPDGPPLPSPAWPS